VLSRREQLAWPAASLPACARNAGPTAVPRRVEVGSWLGSPLRSTVRRAEVSRTSGSRVTASKTKRGGLRCSHRVGVWGQAFSGPSRVVTGLLIAGRRPLSEPGARSAAFCRAILTTLGACSLTRACSGQRTACFNSSVVPFWRRTLQPRRWWSALFVAAEARSVRQPALLELAGFCFAN